MQAKASSHEITVTNTRSSKVLLLEQPQECTLHVNNMPYAAYHIHCTVN